MKIKKRRKATTNGLRLAPAPAPQILDEAAAPTLSVVPDPIEAPQDVPATPAPVLPGTVRMISDAEASAVLAANRAILHAQEDAKATVVRLNERIASAKAALAALVEGYAVAHGISLDTANGRWHFDVASGSFTRLQDEATS